MTRRPPPLPPPPDDDPGEIPGSEWDDGPDSRHTVRIPAKTYRRIVSQVTGIPTTPPDGIPVVEGPFDDPPLPMQAIQRASTGPLGAPVERAVMCLAWVVLGCTLMLAAAVLAAAMILR